MTRQMELRWLNTICAVMCFAWMVVSPEIVSRLCATLLFVSATIQATWTWRDYLEWRVFWDAEQRKGMPE